MFGNCKAFKDCHTVYITKHVTGYKLEKERGNVPEFGYELSGIISTTNRVWHFIRPKQLGAYLTNFKKYGVKVVRLPKFNNSWKLK